MIDAVFHRTYNQSRRSAARSSGAQGGCRIARLCVRGRRRMEENTTKASLFITCLIDNFYPSVGESVVQILDRLGVQVDFPERQTCCGQPAFNSGYVSEARAVASTMLDAFRDSEYVVTASGSCAGMVHHYYHSLFSDDAELTGPADELVRKTFEFSDFLVNVLGVTDVGAVFPHRVTYHPSCHGARLLGVRDEPGLLLSNVRDIKLVELPYADDCCGFGGAFAVKMSDISSAMVSEKSQHVLETDAEVLVSGDMGCLMNIGGRLRRQGSQVRVMHLADLLYRGIQIAEGATER